MDNRINKMKTFLGNSFVKEYIEEYINNNLKPEIDFFENQGVYYIFSDEGVELFFEEELEYNELKYIFFHLNNEDDGYRPYKKKLPFNLSITNTKQEVRQILGNPSKENKAIPLIDSNFSQIFDRNGFKIVVEYVSDLTKIKTISIQR